MLTLCRGDIPMAKGDLGGAIIDFCEGFDKGDLDDAIVDYTESSRLKPDYADFFLNRGLSYAAKKAYREAIADREEALRLNSDHTQVTAARNDIA